MAIVEIPYERCLKRENTRVLLNSVEIGTVHNGNVLLSNNNNVITICLKDMYYHVNITDVVYAILRREVP